MSRDLFPIYDLKNRLIAESMPGCRIVLQAPTGSGKSTQVPQMLLDGVDQAGGQIVVLQPRRIAARLLARRVAEERQCEVGAEVGYQVRFESHVSRRTRIRYVTEGVLLRQWIDDPDLAGISTIIFDEFHERHVYGDISLACALQLQRTSRPDLRIVVMSATLDMGALEDFLNPCTVLSCEGRVYPVETEYLPRAVDFRKTPVWEAAAEAFQQLASGGLSGHVLVFMPGAYEIRRTIEAIRYMPAAKGMAVLPLHGQLPPGQQDEAVSLSASPRVIVATNVAETSITIDGIVSVIDSGLARVARYDPHRGIDTLYIEKISQASAAQRAGRAGRTQPGLCFRLWTEQEQNQRPLQGIPEIMRVDLAEVILMLKACGVDAISEFQWLDHPGDKALSRAEILLHDLGAISRDGELLPVGRQMVNFPVHPRYSRMLLAADRYGCVRQTALIAALTQGQPLLLRKVDKCTREAREELFGESFVSDFFMLMKAWRFADVKNYAIGPCRNLGIHAGAARQVKPLYERFLRIAQKEGLAINDRPPEDCAIQKTVLSAFSDNLAIRCDKGTLRCRLVHQRSGVLVRNSVIRDSPLFTVVEIAEIESGRGEVNVLLSMATAVEEAWLAELFPEDLTEENRAKFDPRLKRVISIRSRLFRDLVLEEKVSHEVDAESAGQIMAEEIERGNIVLSSWDRSVEEWIARVNCLSDWCPDWEIPRYDETALKCILQEFCLGAVSVKDLKRRKVLPVIKQWLSSSQQKMVVEHAPDRLKIPSGRNIKLRYAEGSAPVLSATIQHLYDLEVTPTIAAGRQKVKIEVLAPNQRPQQVTENMESFWQDTYPVLKKELKGRYPKHEWR